MQEKDDVFESEDAEPKPAPRPPVPANRPRAGLRHEPEIYIEDALDVVSNKYLAVNIASRRARQLNEMELPVGERAKNAKKPTTQALLELIDGHLRYESLDVRPPEIVAEDETIHETDDEVAEILEEYEDTDDADDFDFDGFDDDDT